MSNEYDAKFRLVEAPTATDNGSGLVGHSLQGIARPSGTSDAFELVPGFERVVYVSSNLLNTVLSMAAGPEKINAYRRLLEGACLLRPTIQPLSFSSEGIRAAAEANAFSEDMTAQADAYITDLAGDYPVDFAL